MNITVRTAGLLGRYLPPGSAGNEARLDVDSGATPLDVGIPAQVFTTRASMPYEVRVCGAAPGLVTGGVVRSRP